MQQIRERTLPEQWHYVDGKNNPADDASRGLSPKDLLQSSRWLHGPSFLWEHRGNWRDFNKSAPEPLQLDDKEVKKASSLATSVSNKEEPATLLQRLEGFSSWFRAKRAVAVCLRYLRILLNQLLAIDKNRVLLNLNICLTEISIKTWLIDSLLPTV